MSHIPLGKQWAIIKDGPHKGSDNVFVSEEDAVAVLPDNLMTVEEELEHRAKLEEERMRIQTHHLVVPVARKDYVESKTRKPTSYHIYRRAGWDEVSERPVFTFQKTIVPPRERIQLRDSEDV